MTWLGSWMVRQERELREDDVRMLDELKQLQERSLATLEGLSNTVTVLRNKEKARQSLRTIMGKKDGNKSG